MNGAKNEISKFEKASASIVIAAFNEEKAVGQVVHGLCAEGYRVIVVDDGSKDDTAKIALEAGGTVLRHPVNRGQGAALQTGITYALINDAKVVVTFDADGQHRIEDIGAILRPILDEKVDIVLGSRFLDKTSKIPLGRKMLLGAAVVFMRLTSGTRLTDAHNGFRAFSRRAALKIDIQLDQMAHASELVDQIRHIGLPFCEVPVTIDYTKYSMQKGQNAGNAVRVAADYLVNKIVR